MPVPLRSPDEIDSIGRTGRLLWSALGQVIDAIRAGQTSREVESRARRALALHGLEPLLEGYRAGASPPFPGVACVCINEEAVHAVPSGRIIRDGDLVTIDLAGRFSDWCADAARSVIVGADSQGHAVLHDATCKALDAALCRIGPGVRWSEVAAGAATAAEGFGFRLVRGYDGHGIGRDLHEAPRAALAALDTAAPHDFVLRPGMVITIEPVLTSGSARVVTLDDGWTVVTADRAPSCHEERTVAVVRGGRRVLTGPAP